MSAAAAAATVAAISAINAAGAARKAHVLKCTADNFVWPLWVHGYESSAIIAASLLLGLIGGLAAYVAMRVFTK